MAKKNTYAAMMKQLSSKKAQYEKGLQEASRTGNRSGIADYNRRLQKLAAGMDELFEAQEASKPAAPAGMAMFENGGGTKAAKAAQGVIDESNAKFMELARKAQARFKNIFPDQNFGEKLQGADGAFAVGNLASLEAGLLASTINPQRKKQIKIAFKEMRKELEAANAEFNTIKNKQRELERYSNQQTISDASQIVEDAGFTAQDYKRYQNFEKERRTGKGIIKPEELEAMSALGQKIYAAEQMGIDPAKGFDGIPFDAAGSNAEASARERLDAWANADMSQSVPIPEGMEYVPTPEERAQMEGANATPEGGPIIGGGPDGSSAGAGSGAGAGTGAGRSYGPAARGEDMSQIAPLSATPILNTAKGDLYYPGGIQRNILGTVADMPEGAIPTKSHGLGDLKNRIGDKIGGLNVDKQALGSTVAGLAQLLPTMASMKQMKNIEGPVDMPLQRVQMLNTDIQVGNQLQKIKEAEARNSAAIAANVSNPVVAAAMRRASQRASQEQIANILGNEASQEAQLRNQNLMNATQTLNQNAMISAQNRQRQIDFENDRIAAMNRMRMSMGDTLGGVYQDMQRAALDREKLKYMREAYDPYNLGATDEERNQ